MDRDTQREKEEEITRKKDKLFKIFVCGLARDQGEQIIWRLDCTDDSSIRHSTITPLVSWASTSTWDEIG